jgi:acetyl-CoA carboxylase biotin carboxyl carrier protein
MAKREKKTNSSPAAATRTYADLVNIAQIRQLVRLMVDNELRALDIQNGQMRLSIRRGLEPSSPPVTHTLAPHYAQTPAQPPPSHAPAETAQVPTPPKLDEGLIPIHSPMVGTFYAAPDPESPPYVTVGSEINPDTVVCILEAMKVFNEIKAEVAGTVQKVCVENAHPVEFGQPLFFVRPRA